jgi:hypothetical protein
MRLIGLVVIAGFALPTAAHASSVSVYVPPCGLEQSKYAACFPDEARFVADAGEANRLTVTRPTDGELVFKDEGAPLRAGVGCAQVDERTASCKGYAIQSIVTSGDGEDAVTSGFSMVVDAGDGNDVVSAWGSVRGGPGDDTITGGPESDSLQGGTGADHVSGAGGNDMIQPDEDDVGIRDTVDGGDGVDVLSYAGRTTGVTISLQDPASAGDTFAAFESVRGGSGADRLTGDGATNALEGGQGSDVLVGGPGDDHLDGGEGNDQLDGGPGSDRFFTTGRDLVACGDGLDGVGVTGTGSTLGPGCERVGGGTYEGDLNRLVLRLPLPSKRSSLLTVTHLVCFDFPCAVDMRVVVAARKHRGAILGQRLARYRRERSVPKGLALRPSRSGLRLLGRMRGTTARVTFAMNENGERSKVSFLVRLDPPAA